MIKFLKALLAVAILTIIFQSSSAMAQTARPVQSKSACFERAALMKHLDGKFSEAPVAAGLAANGSVLEVFSSIEGETWTIVLTQPNGATCVMASGEAWQTIKFTKKKKGKVS